MTRQQIGQFLSEQREKQNLTQYKAAVASGLRPDHLKKIESGDCNWSEASISRYAGMLGYEITLKEKSQNEEDLMAISNAYGKGM